MYSLLGLMGPLHPAWSSGDLLTWGLFTLWLAIMVSNHTAAECLTSRIVLWELSLTSGTFSPSVSTWWPTYILPKNIIGRWQGLYHNMIVGIQKLYIQHLLPLLMMSQGGFHSSTLSSIKVLKSSLKRALLCNRDVPEEPLLCSWIRLPEHHLSFPLPTITAADPAQSERSSGVRVLCESKQPTAGLPGAEATNSESLMGRISLTSNQSKKTRCNEETENKGECQGRGQQQDEAPTCF